MGRLLRAAFWSLSICERRRLEEAPAALPFLERWIAKAALKVRTLRLIPSRHKGRRFSDPLSRTLKVHYTKRTHLLEELVTTDYLWSQPTGVDALRASQEPIMRRPPMNTRGIARPRTGAVFAHGLQEHGRLTVTTLLGALSSRRSFLRHMGVAGLGLAVAPAWAATTVKLPLPGGPPVPHFPLRGIPPEAATTRSGPGRRCWKRRSRFSTRASSRRSDQFFVRWHWAGIPTEIDVDELRFDRARACQPERFPFAPGHPVASARRNGCVNGCSGNWGLFLPRVAGGQWGNGAMGNARWTGVRLEDVLHRAGVKPGAVAVRFQGLDEAVIDGAPTFLKSLDIDHARDGEVMFVTRSNGEQLPLLNGFPLRLIVPGWYSTYWIQDAQ